MKIPRFVWNRRHGIASITVSFGQRIWDTRDAGDVILGYNATGRLARVIVLNPDELFDPSIDLLGALRAVTEHLHERELIDADDDQVLASAIQRAASGPPTRPVGSYAASG